MTAPSLVFEIVGEPWKTTSSEEVGMHLGSPSSVSVENDDCFSWRLRIFVLFFFFFFWLIYQNSNACNLSPPFIMFRSFYRTHSSREFIPHCQENTEKKSSEMGQPCSCNSRCLGCLVEQTCLLLPLARHVAYCSAVSSNLC